MDSTLTFVTLDVFTQTTFKGNPLAIIKVPASLRYLTQEKKQLIAREFNLSESVFLHEQQDKLIPEWTIDIFTTNDELPFAGHPVIGAASYVLGLNSHSPSGGTFITKAGRVPISLASNEGKVQADIPHNVHIHQHTIGDLREPPSGLSSHPRLREAELRAPLVSIVRGMTFLLVQLESHDDLARVPNTIAELNYLGMLDPGPWEESFVARYYYVVEGDGEQVDGKEVIRIRARMIEETMEDPATGSAASALACYISLKSRRTLAFEVVQGVEMGRKSVIGVDVSLYAGGINVEGVRLSGSAVAVMEGTIRI